MRTLTTQTDGDDRGVSELVGVVLLFGIVIAGSMMIFVSGTGVMDDVRAESRVDSAETAFSSMDGTLQSLAHKQGSSRKTVDLGAVNPNRAEIRDTGELTVTINGKETACSASLDLSALVYQDDGGTTVAYEAGAIWERTTGGLSVKKSPPLSFQEGSLQLEVIQLEGSVDSDQMRVQYDRAESTSRTQAVTEELFEGDESCRRPKTVTVTVNSDYYEGWAQYFDRELPSDTDIDVDAADDTVTAEITIDREYDYVDFPGSGPGTVIDPAGGSDYVEISDGDGSTDSYAGTVTFLGSENANLDSYTEEETVWDNETVNHTVTVSASENTTVPLEETVTFTVEDVEYYWDNETRTVWNNSTVRKRTNSTPPLEVAFVIDESGSMQNEDKMAKARESTRQFLAVMNPDQGHRVSLVGYDYCTEEVYNDWYDAWVCQPGAEEVDTNTYQAFTEDQDAINESLSDLQVGGGTPIPQAIEHTVDEFESNGNDSNNQVMVFLTDGKNTAEGDPVETAQEEIPDDVTVYTIGVGDEVNDDMLEAVAATGDGNGTYIHVEDAEDLDSVFSQIARNETTEIIHYNNSTTITEPHKKSRTVEREVTVNVSSSAMVEATASRTVAASEPYMAGDEVWVNDTVLVDAGETVVVNETLTRYIYGINETVTENVTREATVELTEETSVTINETVVLPPERTTWNNESTTETTERHLVLRRPTTLTMTYNGSDHQPWGSTNLNALDPSIEQGAFANVIVEEGEIHFAPDMHECAANVTHDDQVTIDGTDYNLTTCTSPGPSVNLNEDVSVYTNGSTLPAGSGLSWQTSLEEMLTVDGKEYYEYDGGTMKATNLDSNQVLVIVEADDANGDRDANNVVLLLEIGKSKDDASGEHLVNVQVRAVSAEEDDED